MLLKSPQETLTALQTPRAAAVSQSSPPRCSSLPPYRFAPVQRSSSRTLPMSFSALRPSSATATNFRCKGPSVVVLVPASSFAGISNASCALDSSMPELPKVL
ncbi:hypothetical protein D3C80_1679770 [compost metagenome]